MPKVKRESRQFIVINEEKLISEVKERPILYDKALKGYRKPAIREGAWQEVAILLDSSVEECKKRWRSLRDAFMKQLKVFQRGDQSIRKRWLFYEQMEFLAKYFDGFNDGKFEFEDELNEPGCADLDTVNHRSIRKSTATPINQHILCIAHPQEEYETHQIDIDEYNEEQLEDEDDETALLSQHHDALETDEFEKKHQNTNSNVYIVNDTELDVQHLRNQSKNISQSYTNDPDERFLLSCLPILKRLSNKKNALARLKIQQLLFDVEFNDCDGATSNS